MKSCEKRFWSAPTCRRFGMSGGSRVSLKNRKPRKDHLHIHAGIYRRAVGVRNVFVLVADRECSAVAVDDLNAAAEIESEVEARGAGHRHLFVEVEEASGGLTEWLHAPIATEVEFQTDGRQAPAVDALASLRHGEASGSIWHRGESLVREYRERNSVDRPFKRDGLAGCEHAAVSQANVAEPRVRRFAD